MTNQPEPGDRVLVTAKRLDSDDVTEAEFGVEAPTSELALRQQLTELVSTIYPDAAPRSFADNAATFLAPKLLIVAVFRSAGDGDAADVEDDGSQQQLFAA